MGFKGIALSVAGTLLAFGALAVSNLDGVSADLKSVATSVAGGQPQPYVSTNAAPAAADLNTKSIGAMIAAEKSK